MSALTAGLPRHVRRLPRRLRIVLATRPLAYWLLTALVAIGIGYAVAAVVRSAQEARASFGTLTPALVATRAIVPGEPLDAGNTTIRQLPVALVPEGVVAALPSGGIASASIAAGEPVHRLRVGRGGLGPVAALLSDGTRGIAVAIDEGGLPLLVGDRVDVVAAVASGGGGAARVVAAAAEVAHVGERSVVVAVAAEEVPAVAQALADGGVVLALSASR